ncbi:MAG: GtrA family protein [Candidatus Onthomonas sp.]|nr:GtrA family protein [Candidatus Onthomonas sp.]
MQKLAGWFWALIARIARFLLERLFRLTGREMPEEFFQTFLQFVRFGIVGVTNTLVSYGVYVVSLLILRKLHCLPDVDYYAAQFMAFLLSVLWSFYWNNKVVFTLQSGEQRSWWKSLLKTYASYSFTGLFLNSLLLYVWVQVFHISEFLAPIINLLISVPLNFVINKFWAFRSDRTAEKGR